MLQVTLAALKFGIKKLQMQIQTQMQLLSLWTLKERFLTKQEQKNKKS
jgi:hypothetical protein